MDDLIGLKQLKDNLWSLRLHLAKLRRSEPWQIDELDRSLSKLKPNKARDTHGWINKLFKSGVMGQDLKSSLLTLVNKDKESVFLSLWNGVTLHLYIKKNEIS